MKPEEKASCLQLRTSVTWSRGQLYGCTAPWSSVQPTAITLLFPLQLLLREGTDATRYSANYQHANGAEHDRTNTPFLGLTLRIKGSVDIHAAARQAHVLVALAMTESILSVDL